jgi:trimeric autotransporter adhesin
MSNFSATFVMRHVDRAKRNLTARVLQSACVVAIAFSFTACGSAGGSSGATGGGLSDAPNLPTITIAPSSLNFGSQIVGSSTSRDLTFKNTGSADLSISNISVTGAGYTLANTTFPITIPSNQSVVVQVQFVPLSTGPLPGSATVTSNASNTVQPVTLSGVGVTNQPDVSFSPTILNFNTVVIGTSKSLNLTINSIGGAALTVNQVNVSGTSYTLAGFPTPLTLNPNQSVTGQVIFSPTATAPSGGSVTVTSNAISSPSVTLNGSGATATRLLSVSPTTLPFGNVMVGSNTGLLVTLRNGGNSSLTVSAANPTGDYTVTQIVLPTTIAAGGSQTANINFAPQVTGPDNGTVSFVSTATNSPAVVTTTGTGITGGAHSVDLSWDASVTPTVVGYFIYRGSSSGGPYTKLNANAQVATVSTDLTVNPGDTYFYVVTAVDSDGIESFVSDEATAPIPTP